MRLGFDLLDKRGVRVFCESQNGRSAPNYLTERLRAHVLPDLLPVGLVQLHALDELGFLCPCPASHLAGLTHLENLLLKWRLLHLLLAAQVALDIVSDLGPGLRLHELCYPAPPLVAAEQLDGLVELGHLCFSPLVTRRGEELDEAGWNCARVVPTLLPEVVRMQPRLLVRSCSDTLRNFAPVILVHFDSIYESLVLFCGPHSKRFASQVHFDSDGLIRLTLIT